ncbi:hypothetical protein POVWA2_046180 [Plasmodium ovale wallikeri]|uniref:Uncharacterized protein n=1 Tax=Plasmodium ovale wallikeri TaxID=864142 RepID=A0A1A8ZI61_PLAOA|nr:hypothetical protein POVWA2_046180 [Plasmodium ovale wallikeri]
MLALCLLLSNNRFSTKATASQPKQPLLNQSNRFSTKATASQPKQPLLNQSNRFSTSVITLLRQVSGARPLLNVQGTFVNRFSQQFRLHLLQIKLQLRID